MASDSTTPTQLHQLPLSLQTAYAELVEEQIRQEIELEKSFNMKRQALQAIHAAEQEDFWAGLRNEPIPVQRQERRPAHLGLQYAGYNDHPTSPELESQYEEEAQLPLESIEPVEVIDLVSDDDDDNDDDNDNDDDESDDESVQFTGEAPIDVDSSDVADFDQASPSLYSSSGASGRSSSHSSSSSSSPYSDDDDDDDSVQYIGQQPVNHSPSNTPDLPPTPYMGPLSRAPSSTTPLSSYSSTLSSGPNSPYSSPATPYMGPLSRAATPPSAHRPPFSPLLMPVSPGWSRLISEQRPVSPPLSSAAPGRTLSDYNIGRTLSDYNNQVRVDKRKRAVSVSSGEISDLDLDEGETESPGAKRQRRG